MVVVYYFEVWDQLRGENLVQPLKSDANRIKQVGGTILPGTGEEVDVADLDADGRYGPKKRLGKGHEVWQEERLAHSEVYE